MRLQRFTWLWLTVFAFCCSSIATGADDESKVYDLSLLVAPELPCTWPAGWPLYQINHYRTIGPLSPYHVDILIVDPNTGTQMDVPPHSIPQPDSGLPNAGEAGKMYSDRVPAWQFGGAACVIDCRELAATATNGQSPLVTRELVQSWEREHSDLKTGDVVLVRSDYSDRFYRPLPEGRRFLADPVEGVAPGWPDPEPDCMEYLASRGVMLVGTDSPSMGPIPDLAEPTHVAGLKHGMIFTEGATGLGQLPATGAFYCMLAPKHVGGAGGEARALAITGGALPRRLIEAVRKQHVVDLSVPLSPELPVTWPGRGVGNARQPYFRVLFGYAPNVDMQFHTHMMDSHAGTHLVPPSYALPGKDDPPPAYSPQVRGWLQAYESKYGQRGTSDVTVDEVPLEQTCGPMRVIDVSDLCGTTQASQWPASPAIDVDLLRAYEEKEGKLMPGEIVVFHSGFSDRFFRPMPEGSAAMEDPLNGKSEGWPAPTPEAIAYLADRGIRCVATDAPTLGGVDEQQALAVYWLLGSRGMVGIEYLTNVGKVPKGAYFVFAAPKLYGAHGAPGRALAFY